MSSVSRTRKNREIEKDFTMPLPIIARKTQAEKARAQARNVSKPAGCKSCAAKRAALAVKRRADAQKSRSTTGSSTNRWRAPK